MPQFFRQWSHFPDGHDATAAAFEPIDILGIVTYLRRASQDFQYLEQPMGVAEASAERGKVLFEERGCLACTITKIFPARRHFAEKTKLSKGRICRVLVRNLTPSGIRTEPNGCTAGLSSLHVITLEL